MCIITGIEIASDATHSVHKCTNITTDNACRCSQSAFNSFDTTDWGVARSATCWKISAYREPYSCSFLSSVIHSYHLSSVGAGRWVPWMLLIPRVASWTCLCVCYPKMSSYNVFQIQADNCLYQSVSGLAWNNNHKNNNNNELCLYSTYHERIAAQVLYNKEITHLYFTKIF